MNIAIL